MDALLSQLGNYGPTGALGGIIIWILYTRLNKLEARIEADNAWKMQVIENDTKATIGSTAAQTASTSAIQQLTETVKSLERRYPS